MKIVLAQYFTNNLSYGKFSKAINERYCQKHGYIYHLESDTTKITTGADGRDFTWYKPKFLADVFQVHQPDYVLFLDADAVVQNEETKIEQFIETGIDILAAQDHGNCKLNAGVILLKHTPWTIKFLADLWATGDEFPQYKRGIWHEQTCFGLLMDRTVDVGSHIKIITNAVLNCRYREDENAFVFHAFGYGDIKNRTLDQMYYRRFNILPPVQVGDSLEKIASNCITDKSYFHNYVSKVYEDLFAPVRDSTKLFVEIGIGAGDSLWMWHKYFDHAKIVGVDIVPLAHMPMTQGSECLVYNQADDKQLEELSEKINGADIIIDDGSHRMKDQQRTLAILFKHLKPGGIYVLEDLHTSLECHMPSKAVFGWGDPTKTTALELLENYNKNGKFVSDYMSVGEMEYLNEHVENVQVYRLTENSITSVIRKKKVSENLGVVYHVFCVGNWENIVSEQLAKLKDNGLYDEAEILWMTVNDLSNNKEKVDAFISEYPKFNLDYRTTNGSEGPGVRKVYELCQQNETLKVLYFHAKGVSNTYKTVDKREPSERKMKCSQDWRRCMEHFLILGWRDCVKKLDDYDIVVTTHTDGVVWGNFYWTNADFIRLHEYPQDRDRWYYEYWLTMQHSPKVHEYYHFCFLGLISDLPHFFYDGTLIENEKIELISASYGALDLQLDEGYPPVPDDVSSKIADITQYAQKNLEDNGFVAFDGRICSTWPAGLDPYPGGRKHLTLRFRVRSEELSLTFSGGRSEFKLHNNVSVTKVPKITMKVTQLAKKKIAFFTPMAGLRRNTPISATYKKCIIPFYKTAQKFFLPNHDVDFLFLTNSNETCELDFVKTIKFDEEITDYSYGCLMKILAIEYVPDEYDYIFVADSDSVFANEIIEADMLSKPFVFLDHYYKPSLQSILDTDTYIPINVDVSNEKWTMDTFIGGTSKIMRNFNKFSRQQHDLHLGEIGPKGGFYSYYPGEFFILKYVFENRIDHKRLSSCCEIGGTVEELKGKMWHIGELPNNFDSKNGLGLEFFKHYQQLHQTKMKLDILDEVTKYILGEPSNLPRLKADKDAGK